MKLSFALLVTTLAVTSAQVTPFAPLKPKAPVGSPVAPLKPTAPVGSPRAPVKPTAPVGSPFAPLKPTAPVGSPRAPVKPTAPVGSPRAPVAPLKPTAPVNSPRAPVKPTAPVGSPVACNCDALQTKLDSVVAEFQKKLDDNNSVLADLQKKLDNNNSVVADLQKKLDNNNSVVADLQKKLDTLNNVVAGLQANNTALQDKTSCISSDSSSKEFYFRGCNVHVQNGEGSTTTTNSYGNLVVGYNEQMYQAAARTGSHNVIVGDRHEYTSYGGIVGGYYNTISGEYSSVAGGAYNTASGTLSSIAGGYINKASGDYSSVAGGTYNTASGLVSVIVGNNGDFFGTTSCADYSVCPVNEPPALKDLQDKTSCISSDSSATNLIFRGCNVHVQNGEGSTTTKNSYGNLVVGYNEQMYQAAARTGSHNVIVGDRHEYTSYGGIVGGYYNTISGEYSSVAGGAYHTASGILSSIAGGYINKASGDYSSVAGGTYNTASGLVSVIVGNKGGYTGTTSCADYSVCPVNEPPALKDLQDKTSCISSDSSANNLIFRGCNVHVQNGEGSTTTTNSYGNLVVGYNEQRDPAAARTGSHNVIVGDRHEYTSYGGIVGGWFNTISGQYSSITGGYANEASGDYSSVSGGYFNKASGHGSSISGGQSNVASGQLTSVAGGNGNEAEGEDSAISGGKYNKATGLASVVVGNKGDIYGTTSCANYKICPANI